MRNKKMALNRQVQILNVDTGDFYSNHEKALHNKNHKLRLERIELKKNIAEMEEKLKSNYGFSEATLREVVKATKDGEDVSYERVCNNYNLEGLKKSNAKSLLEDYVSKNIILKKKKNIIDASKNELLKILENKVEQNIISDGKHHTRVLNEDSVSNKSDSVISIFESETVRTLGIEINELSDSLIVVQVYYFDMFKDIMYFGFEYKGEKYIYYTSSAGQIRTKKAVFIKEKEWNKHCMRLMCGLTLEKINEKGGSNPNKYLAYTALQNSATDVWEEFDIDKTIVIDDFENDVFGTYDFIDEKDYSITRKRDYVPIPHTDGCGMMLPRMGNNRMVRLCWVKGLLGAFDYVQFIKEHNCSGKIVDIYGKEHDIIAEDIEVIFTKSQFKMYKYYESWEEYKENFKKYGCNACYTNMEQDKISNATINYQMLQTFTEFTDEDLQKLISKSVYKLENIGSSVENMMEIFGCTENNADLTSLQQAVMLYPNIMNDEFFKVQLRSLKDSLIKKYKSGKLEVNGKYTFVFPDLYACCEHWFLGEENPKGLLADGEVFCNLFKNNHEIDCLRSPHLYKEHCVRYNMASTRYDDRNAKMKKWFCTNGIYTSCHDLISKILQFDVDGDNLLVVADKIIVDLAKRNTKGIVPLYYNMRKAEAVELNNRTIYDGLIHAFTGGNIGVYSNDISKIWNSPVFQNGTEEEKQNAIDIVKLLCCENNFVIDYAKTLYKPTRPKDIDEKIKAFTNNNLPHFFTYAKDKSKGQVESVNESLVNRLDGIIPNPRLNCSKANLGKLNYEVLVSNKDIEVNVAFDRQGRIVEEKTDKLICEFVKVAKEIFFDVSVVTRIAKIENDDNASKTKTMLKNEEYRRLGKKVVGLLEEKTGMSKTDMTDILVKYQYVIKPTKRKTMLWICFGDVIVENIKRNLSTMSNEEINMEKRICECCGKTFFTMANARTTMCCNCARKKKNNDRRKKRTCIDCGSSNVIGRSLRCEECKITYNRIKAKERKSKERENRKVS